MRDKNINHIKKISPGITPVFKPFELLWNIIRFPIFIMIGTLIYFLLTILPYIHWLILGLVLGGILRWIYTSRIKEA